MRQDNKILVEHFAGKVKASGNNIFITGFQGMTEENLVDLRKKLDEQSAEHRILKNRLFKIISSKVGIVSSDKLDAVLKGSSSFTIGGKDVVSVAKVISEYEKENQKLVIKGGILDGKFITADEVKALASLPSRSELLAKVVGAIAAPLQGLVGVLNAQVSSVVNVISALKDKKSESK